MLLNEIRAALPEGCLIDDPDSIVAFVRDDAAWSEYGTPIAVVRAGTALDVQAVVRACIAYGVPVVPRGAGTGLSGGANAVDGCVVIALDRMDAIREINMTERLAVVEPGVVNDRLREACAAHGLWYPPDPASSAWSTIGGNVATNAGGICCVKYGVTSDYVLALEVVTGTGEIVRVGRRTAKGVAGYDLAHLLVGSEGTLGIITEITVKLRPLRPAERTVAGHFASIVDAGRAVAAIGAAGIVPSALELIDRHCLAAVDAWKNMGLAVDANAVLLARCDTAGASGDEEADAILACFLEAGATWADRSTDEIEADALFEARRLAYPALKRLGSVLTEDVCVPKGAVPEMLARIDSIAEAHDIIIANIAHAGDGNLHPLLVIPPGDDEARIRAQAAFEEILDGAIALGGTVTGEHGVGMLKLDGYTREASPDVLAMNQAVKDALDPHGILNPGKLLPRRTSMRR
ncbi:FAD-binding oxidoreductase [Agromyces aerolatus]|uniref:FAD-binding oxidoreductase n=1 Tax=Agromyces sp. LY-1074 TaxID=3074080 RepID=UPI00285C69D9|nr:MULTISPECIES: FAD-linked oxidase C-terminal domain-containing protein [unclassified Agromyces]MDR5700456.1 FAD-linked oxidase C-terminal domain-containing protein [Agromyces sp. LY-1074]MDR5706977.1 FAD-linked oxidase C-terminal domain-containing protein [Agromyces sp. LY-1358]